MVNKNELINRYSKLNCVTKDESKNIIEDVIDLIKTAIIEDGGIDFHGFMKIEKVHKAESEARNPVTGEKVLVAAKDVPKAKFSNKFKKEVNGEV